MSADSLSKMANSYDALPWQKTMISQMTTELRNRVDWIRSDWPKSSSDESPKIRFLDYACGTGLVSRVRFRRICLSLYNCSHLYQALGPWVAETRGIDLSEKMVETYNRLASEAGLSPSTIHAVQGNFLDEKPSEAILQPEFYNFDVAAIGLGFHHFELDTQVTMLKRITERLKPGGQLLILDFFHGATGPDGKPITADEVSEWQKEAQNTVAATGFTKEHMQQVYEAAGLGDFSLQVFEEPINMIVRENTRVRIGFLSKGSKV